LFRRRALVTAGIALAVVVATASPAFAHVEIEPPSLPKGGEDTIAFRVPNEEDNASTVKLEVQFPTDHPIPQVLVNPPPGWTATVETTKLATPIQTDDGAVTEAVSQITWSGGKIEPGQYERFEVLVGSLPTDVDQLEFKAVQTYSNGNVVRWIEDTPSSGPEPEHPAPILKLTAPGTASSSSDTASSTEATVGIVLGAVGIILALAAGALAIGARRRRTS
jgi:uncharacterized protein YcnI